MKMLVRFALAEPTLILGVGISGSGKSTVLKPLAEMLYDSVYFEKDLLNYVFLRHYNRPGPKEDMLRYVEYQRVPREDPKNTHYRDHVLFQSYAFMLDYARQLLAMGKHPILEGNYVKEIRFGYIEQVLKPQLVGVDYKLKLVLTHAPAKIIRQRLIARAAEHDRIKLSNDEEWEKLITEQPPVPPEIEGYPHIKVDMTNPLTEQQLFGVIAFLAS